VALVGTVKKGCGNTRDFLLDNQIPTRTSKLARVSEKPWMVSAKRAELPESHANTPFVPATRMFRRVEKNAIADGLVVSFLSFLFITIFLQSSYDAFSLCKSLSLGAESLRGVPVP
jgi:hypothetical protein